MVWMRELGLQGDVISQHGGGWMKTGIWTPHFELRGVFCPPPPLYHAAQNHILSSHTYFLLLLLLPNHKQCNMIINLRGMDCITSELCYFIYILICISPLFEFTDNWLFHKAKENKEVSPYSPQLAHFPGKGSPSECVEG